MISREVEVQAFAFPPGVKFMVCGSGGLWSGLSNKTCGENLIKGEDAAKTIVAKAVANGCGWVFPSLVFLFFLGHKTT